MAQAGFAVRNDFFFFPLPRLRNSLWEVIAEMISAPSNRWFGVTTASSASKHVCLLAVNYSNGLKGVPEGAGHLLEVVVTLALGLTPWHPRASRATDCRLARPPGSRLGALVARWVFFFLSLSLARVK